MKAQLSQLFDRRTMLKAKPVRLGASIGKLSDADAERETVRARVFHRAGQRCVEVEHQTIGRS